MDIPFQNPELELFTDGSSFIQDGQCKAGSAIATMDERVKAEAWPQGWSAQRAELWALAQALRHAKGKRVNVYTDSRYAFATSHMHGAIYKERGPLTAGGKEIKNKKEILQLLQGVWKPSQAAVIHCKGEELIQSAKEIGWLTRQSRRQQPNQAPQWALSQSLRSSWHQNCLRP